MRSSEMFTFRIRCEMWVESAEERAFVDSEESTCIEELNYFLTTNSPLDSVNLLNKYTGSILPRQI